MSFAKYFTKISIQRFITEVQPKKRRFDDVRTNGKSELKTDSRTKSLTETATSTI